MTLESKNDNCVCYSVKINVFENTEEILKEILPHKIVYGPFHQTLMQCFCLDHIQTKNERLMRATIILVQYCVFECKCILVLFGLMVICLEFNTAITQVSVDICRFIK